MPVWAVAMRMVGMMRVTASAMRRHGAIQQLPRVHVEGGVYERSARNLRVGSRLNLLRHTQALGSNR